MKKALETIAYLSGALVILTWLAYGILFDFGWIGKPHKVIVKCNGTTVTQIIERDTTFSCSD